MRSIAILNQKGGVGKTTTAVNLSAALAKLEQRVCLIDIDPQAHASLHLGIDQSQIAGSMYDVLAGDAPLAEILVRSDENLVVAPAHIDLAAVEVELAGTVGRELVMRDKLAALEQEFDYVIVDCPPSLGILTLNALCAVREVLLPLQPHFFALHGLSKLMETIDLVANRLNADLRLGGVVFCMFDTGTRLAAEVRSNVDYFFEASRQMAKPWSSAEIYDVAIRRNIRLAEAPSFGQSIFQYAADSNGAADYSELADAVLRQSTPLVESRAA